MRDSLPHFSEDLSAFQQWISGNLSETSKARQTAEKALFLAKSLKSIPQGIHGWVETHPYQSTFI
jgi:hypothetical protein